MTHTTQFSKTGGDGYDRQVSGIDLMSGESIINNQPSQFMQTGSGGNIVQIQRIKLVPLNTNTLFHPAESRISSSPRRSLAGVAQTTQRGTAQGGERSVFLGTVNSLMSRFHST